MEILEQLGNLQFVLLVIIAGFVFVILYLVIESNSKSINVRNRIANIRAIKKQKILLSGDDKRDMGLIERIRNYFQEKMPEDAYSEETRLLLARAGIRDMSYLSIYTILKFTLPLILFVVCILYFFVVFKTSHAPQMKLFMSVGIALAGSYLPKLILMNKAIKRQTELKRYFSDTLDLMIICVDAGMSVENALLRIVHEVGRASVIMAEEIELTSAELSLLPERRLAYENLAKRTNMKEYKALATILIQSERYGTPLGQGLRVLAQEQREARVQEVEKKAAALPAKLTVPLIIFFLPVLFCIILGPAMIQVAHTT